MKNDKYEGLNGYREAEEIAEEKMYKLTEEWLSPSNYETISQFIVSHAKEVKEILSEL